MSKKFKLSTNLYGHSLDVRCLYVTADNSIISGSRDKTAKLWKPNSINPNYSELITYKDQKKFVGSVLYLEPNDEFPEGLVLVGGNDNCIFIYKTHEPFASFVLKEHTDAVCCLAKSSQPNHFLSSSWDTTAKYWQITSTQPKVIVNFTGHAAAVWSVLQLQNGNVVTGSADKSVCIWTPNGQKIHTLQSHTDCVRGIADFPELSHFKSVSNDATIKVWSYAGELLQTYYGHKNFIYSIAQCKNKASDAFVTSDEDRTVRYWENGTNTETIQLPAQSIWCVSCLNNGDIVVGASDGLIRIFTCNESRVADEITLNKFNEDVDAIIKQSVQEIGGYKISDLPGREALYEPGKKAGQMKMVRENNAVNAYTWVVDGENSHWEKVGEVMGGVNKDQTDRPLFEGKAYDQVFTVDVEDGKPPLKLPYNKGDDPYKVANEFLTKNMLPASYLEQVVDFILKNTKDSAVPAVNNEYVDPFTGASRYTPGGTNVQASAGMNVDPFTGANSYSTAPHTVQGTKYFPQTNYRSFEMGDGKVILAKLKEFNKQSNQNVDETILDGLIQICSGTPDDSNAFDVLFKLLDWPDEILFPVLDIVRMAVRHQKNNEIIASINNGILIEKLKFCTSENNKVLNNLIVALRTLCNLFIHEFGRTLVFQHGFELLENVTSLSALNRNGQVALATFLLNFVVFVVAEYDDVGISVLAEVLPDVLTKLTDMESQFRALVAIGTLLTGGKSYQNDEVKLKLKSNDKFMENLKLYTLSGGDEVERKKADCAKQIEYILTQ